MSYLDANGGINGKLLDLICLQWLFDFQSAVLAGLLNLWRLYAKYALEIAHFCEDIGSVRVGQDSARM